MTIELLIFCLFFLIFKINASSSSSDINSISTSLTNYDEHDFEIIKYSDYIITIYSEVEAKPCFYFCNEK